MLGRLIERRGAFQELWGSGALFARESSSGVQVTQDESLRLSAVYACLRLISDTISTLPLQQYRRNGSEREVVEIPEPWIERPSTLLDRPTFYQQWLVSLLLDGNAFIAITRDAGRIVELNVLNPLDVDVRMTPAGKTYRLRSTGRVLNADDVLHATELLLPGASRGVSRIDKAKEAIGLGLALEEYAARFFGSGAFAGGIIEWPGDIDPDQARELVNSWEGSHKGLRRAHRPAVLYGGAKFTPTTADPTESQLLDERRFAVEEVARLFRVPPWMLGVTTPGSVSYASVEQQMLYFVQHTIQPYTQKVEASLNSLLRAPGQFVKFNLSSLVRADLSTRFAAYASGTQAGWMSINDVRAWEDLPAVANGDEYRVPLQNIPVTDSPIVTVNEKARAAQALVNAGFTGDSVAALLDLDVAHSGTISVQQQPEVQE